MITHDGTRRAVRGKVWLVGAGPGDPDLLTVKATKVLATADVVAYDELVSPAILALAPESAERIAVGRRAGGCRHHEARIHPLIVTRALEGRRVVRLKGGDPFVFGRGGEELEELAAARVPCEVVPGISAAFGAAASTRLPLTLRGVSTSVTLATAHAAEGSHVPTGLPHAGTIVFYMGLGRIDETLAALVREGRDPRTPAAVIAHATLPTERVVTGTLADLAARAREAAVEAPALVVVGEVVAARSALLALTGGDGAVSSPARAVG
jgi:uroporphyrin-III C-methyltransferase